MLETTSLPTKASPGNIGEVINTPCKE
ncbi:hypothetical protein E2C01_082515 [Portunus trituberculatus]|uniref:Uncharacterized protein n=1 Tax=Portunus trituberculatus TaxID=210409 RepID=A0A5B7J556_PORTR|nr:hypothetical protein [Portunus trituberculatus]